MPKLQEREKLTPEQRAEINRRNAQRSTGPTTEEGKAASRRNALKHGLTGKGTVLPDELEEDSANRLEGWLAATKVVDDIDRDVVAAGAKATSRLFQCHVELDDARRKAVGRAQAGWESDRECEADDLMANLGRDPLRSARRMKRTVQGARQLLVVWRGLEARLEKGLDWREDQREFALDLLGVPEPLRDDHSPVDLFGADPEALRAHRLAIAAREIRSIEWLIADHLDVVDECERESLARGIGACRDPEVRRLERYGRELERSMWRSLREIERRNLRVSDEPHPAAKARPQSPTAAAFSELRRASISEAEELDSMNLTAADLAAELAVAARGYTPGKGLSLPSRDSGGSDAIFFPDRPVHDEDLERNLGSLEERLAVVEGLLQRDDETGYLPADARLEGLRLREALRRKVERLRPRA